MFKLFRCAEIIFKKELLILQQYVWVIGKAMLLVDCFIHINKRIEQKDFDQVFRPHFFSD